MPVVHRNISFIQLKFVEDVHESFNEGAGTNYPQAVARYQSCASWTPNKTFKSTGRKYNPCEITLGQGISNEVLGHEVLHSFEGNFHGGENYSEELAER
ncbi:hypothetical protein XMA152_001353 [Marinobacterium sp. xm-a-152]|nr:hypothetical protein [Marinobacterium sp. xm-a-152]